MLFLGATPAFADGQQIKLSITPVGADGAYFKVSAKPGETTQLVVQLGNHGDAPLAVRTFPADAYSIVNGGFGAKLDGEATSGATAWIDYAAETLVLEPDTSVTRSFMLSVPADAQPGDYITSLIIQNAEPLQGTGNVALNQVLRQAIAVAIDVPGPRVPALSIGAIAHKMAAGTSFVSFAVTNTGNANLKPAGEFVLTDAHGVEVDRRQVAMGSVYAGNITTLELPYDHLLAAGDYTASLTLTDAATGATAQVAHATLSVPALTAPPTIAQSSATTASAATAAQPTPASRGELSLAQLLGIVGASLVGGGALTVGVLRLRSNRRRSRIAPVTPATAPVEAPVARLNGATANMAPNAARLSDGSTVATFKRLT
jgi:hypothetical protein